MLERSATGAPLGLAEGDIVAMDGCEDRSATGESDGKALGVAIGLAEGDADWA